MFGSTDYIDPFPNVNMYQKRWNRIGMDPIWLKIAGLQMPYVPFHQFPELADPMFDFLNYYYYYIFVCTNKVSYSFPFITNSILIYFQILNDNKNVILKFNCTNMSLQW